MIHPAPRLFAVALALAIGALAGDALSPPPIAAIATGFAAGTALVVFAAKRSSRTSVAVLVTGLALGAALSGLRAASLDRAALAAGARAGGDALLEGKLLGDPESLDPASARMLVGVRRAEIDGRPYRVRERVVLTVRPPPMLAAGDRIRADVRLTPLLRPGADPAARASAARWRRLGVAARAYANATGIERLGRSRDPLTVVAAAGRESMARAAQRLPMRERGLLLGVTIGDTSLLDPVLDQDFRTTGLSHLTAVSGANVAMFLGSIALVLRLLRVGRRATIAVLAFALLAFMTITRLEPSVLRAGAMASVGLAGLAIGARREALTALAVASIGLLVWDPGMVRAIGFQLSALATLGILLLAPRIARLSRGGKLGAAAAVTLGAQLAVAPLIALHFHQFSIVALPANLFAGPAVAPATVLGFVAAAAGLAWEPLGSAAAALARPALTWMISVASVFARLPAASIGLPGGAAGLATIAVLCATPLVVIKARRRPRAAALVLAVAFVAATTVWARALAPPPLRGLVLTALDVGQGDAWLVRTSDGATMLVDGGPDAGRTVSRLRAHGVKRIDLIVMSHPHADHADGMPAVVRAFPVGRAIEPGLDATIPSLGQWRDELDARAVPRDVVRRGNRYALGRATTVDVLGPDTLLEGTDSDLNNNSVVLRLRYGSSCILMSGEVQEEGQDALLRHAEDLRCPVITVPHHGSRRMLPEYFAKTGARLALISVGRNEFGHPSGETLAALAQSKIRVLRTDRSGDTSVALGATGAIEIREERQEHASA